MDKRDILGSNKGRYGQIRAIKGKYAKIRVITVPITFIFIDFAFAFKTQNAPCVLNPFYYQTNFNLRFRRKRDIRLTYKRV